MRNSSRSWDLLWAAFNQPVVTSFEEPSWATSDNFATKVVSFAVEDARRVFNAGADKVAINTSAIKNPKLINELAKHFGSQACVVAIDAKRRYITSAEEAKGKTIVKTPEGLCWYECSIYGGRQFTKIDAVKWAKEVEQRGAGEILLTSMDRDGTTEGYDIPLTKSISEKVHIPVIASGGCGSAEHIYEVLKKTKATAALAASVFHLSLIHI